MSWNVQRRQLVCRVADDLAQGVVHLQKPPVGRDDRLADRCGLEEAAEAGLGVAEVHLGLDAGAEVGDQAEHADGTVAVRG